MERERGRGGGRRGEGGISAGERDTSANMYLAAFEVSEKFA